MRVTQNMINRQLIFSIQRNMDVLDGLNRQLSTGRRVNTVSDDVPDARQIMFLERENGKIDAYLRNISSVDGILSVATSTLEDVSQTITRVKELAVQAATGTYTPNNRLAMSEGVEGLLNTLLGMANVQHNGASVFAGEAAQTTAYEATTDAEGYVTAVSYEGEAISTQVPVGPGMSSEANFVGRRIFQGSADLWETLIALRDAMRANDIEGIQGLIEDLETCHSDVRRSVGQLGERQAQLQLLLGNIERMQDLNLQIISERQDADMAEVGTQYNSQMTLLQMVMNVAARSVKPSILDYL
ncbi:MAG: flagellar hook-associated protein FlgL [Candidatus Brocadiia bacterium]